MFKCRANGEVAVLVNEAYTSKGCSNCGTLKVIGRSEVYNCNRCGYQCDRDIHSAKNMLMKGLLEQV